MVMAHIPYRMHHFVARAMQLDINYATIDSRAPPIGSGACCLVAPSRDVGRRELRNLVMQQATVRNSGPFDDRRHPVARSCAEAGSGGGAGRGGENAKGAHAAVI